MRVLITGGPSSEPIDRVRLITNSSTGELAVTLAERFQQAGYEVELFLGSAARFRIPIAKYFHTNEDLEKLLLEAAEGPAIHAILHTAALADFAVADVDGESVVGAKIPSDRGSVLLRLTTKPKLIGRLRALFPKAYIVGWKLEHEGEDIVHQAAEQIRLNATDACVVNGTAFGEGFGFCTSAGLVRSAANKSELATLLVDVLSAQPEA
jgi:phosphopantothenoylcysteine decarboxylase/phosphopantothenate--cysteine ligase